MNMKLMKCLSSQHLEEIDYIYADSIKTLNNIKVQAIQNTKAQQQKQEEYVFKREILEPSKIDFLESKSENQISLKQNSMDFSIVEDDYQKVIQKTDPSKEEEKGAEEEKKDVKKAKKAISPTKEIADKKKSEPAKKPKILNKKVTKKEQPDEEKEKLNDKQKEKEKDKKEKNKDKEKEKEKDSSKERKRFIDAGVFEADGDF